MLKLPAVGQMIKEDSCLNDFVFLVVGIHLARKMLEDLTKLPQVPQPGIHRLLGDIRCLHHRPLTWQSCPTAVPEVRINV